MAPSAMYDSDLSHVTRDWAVASVDGRTSVAGMTVEP